MPSTGTKDGARAACVAPLAALLAVCGLACGGPAREGAPAPRPASSADAGALPPPPADVDGHLPPTMVPERYEVSLALDPSSDRFAGAVTIAGSVPAPTRYVVLDARDMTIASAVARSGPSGPAGATVQARRSPGSNELDEIVLTFATPLHAGPVQLAISYSAPYANDLSV